MNFCAENPLYRKSTNCQPKQPPFYFKNGNSLACYFIRYGIFIAAESKCFKSA